MNTSTPKTRYERFIDHIKDNRLLSFFLVIGVALTGVAQFSESFDKLLSRADYFKPTPPDSEIVKLRRLPENLEVLDGEVHWEDAGLTQLVLTAKLRNHAAYNVEYPSIEFSVADTKGEQLARWIFRPSDYVSSTTRISGGIPPKATIPVSIKVKADGMLAKPDGFKAYAFYP